MSRNSHYSSDTMKAHVTALCNGFCYIHSIKKHLTAADDICYIFSIWKSRLCRSIQTYWRINELVDVFIHLFINWLKWLVSKCKFVQEMKVISITYRTSSFICRLWIQHTNRDYINKQLSYCRDRIAGGSVLAKSGRRYSSDNIGLSSITVT